MKPVSHNLSNFAVQLENKPYSMIVKQVAYHWKGLNQDTQLKNIGKRLLKTLDSLESLPIQFSEQKSELRHYYSEYLKEAKYLKAFFRTTKNPALCKLFNEISAKVTALRYRMEACNGGFDPVQHVDGELYQKVMASASMWKKNQKLFVDSALSESDLIKLKEVCIYPKFVKLLLRDNVLCHEFFKWVLRDNNSIEAFLQFPATCNTLRSVFIAPRLNNFGGEALTITKIPSIGSSVYEKVLQLPFYNGTQIEKISILDPSRKITLNGNWNLSIKEIFEVFAKKNKEAGNLELVGLNGIMNWNTRRLGSWNPQMNSFSTLDFTNPHWYKQLPRYAVKSQEEILKYYGISVPLGKWLFAYRATREHNDMSLGLRHGFLEIGIPVEGDDCAWTIYPFGEYPKQFPVGKVESFSSINATTYGEISYPDENINYSHRQHAVSPKIINPDEGRKLLDSIAQDIQKGFEKKLIFQPRNENCAFWSQKSSKQFENGQDVNPYKIKIWQSSTFSFLGALPKKYRQIFISALDALLGEYRGLTVIYNGKKTFKSISLMPIQDREYMHQPGWLHEQILAGVLPGRVFAGHN